MADPLEALRGAQSIRDPYADMEVQGAMPGPPWGAGMRAAVQTVSPAVRALRGILGRSVGIPDPVLVEAAPAIRQVAPNLGDVDDMIGALRYNLAKIPSKSAPVEGIGARVAEFAPMGGEATYNSARTANAVVDPAESVYQRLLAARGGLANALTR